MRVKVVLQIGRNGKQNAGSSDAHRGVRGNQPRIYSHLHITFIDKQIHAPKVNKFHLSRSKEAKKWSSSLQW